MKPFDTLERRIKKTMNVMKRRIYETKIKYESKITVQNTVNGKLSNSILMRSLKAESILLLSDVNF